MAEVKDAELATSEQTVAIASVPHSLVVSRGTNRFRRFLLLGLIPALVVLAALYAYLHAGRYVSTDNAYVQTHIVNLAAEVSGTIGEIYVEENQRVEAGVELFALHRAPFVIALARAEAQVAQAQSDIIGDRLAYQQALATLELRQSTAEFASTQLTRQQGLLARQLGRGEDLDAAQYALEAAQRQIKIARQDAAVMLARLDGNADAPVAARPRYLVAKAEYDQAALDLEHTRVYAPFSGIVTNRPELGAFVERGVPILSVVANGQVWVEANFKETQITHIRQGQRVKIEVDSYPGYVWHGRLLSISEATGAEFALLPPQNATGNWVKIVQRIPMRVEVDVQPDYPPLRIGMSTTVIVDTGHVRSWRDLVPDV